MVLEICSDCVSIAKAKCDGNSGKLTGDTGSVKEIRNEKARNVEDPRFQGHVFRDLTNCSIISLIVISIQDGSSAMSLVLESSKSMKDSK